MNPHLTSVLKKIKSGPFDTLSVWDIDDTLFISPKTHVYVLRKEGSKEKIIKKLTTEEFNGYRLGSNEHFDFFEFRDSHLFFNTAKPLVGNLAKAKEALESKSTMVMVLTARADFNDKEKFLKKFELYGLDMSRDNIHVIRSGNLGMGTAEGKKEVLQTVINTDKFTEAQMYDDDPRNLNAFLSLNSKKTKLSAYIVKKGIISTYNK